MKNTIRFPGDGREASYDSLLREIAVENGYQIPKTSEEVRIFEEKYSEEIAVLNKEKPSLHEILEKGRKYSKEKMPVEIINSASSVDGKYLMVARQGKDITEETEKLMDEAIESLKNNKIKKDDY